MGWAFDITNFVFWIGIGHAGTLISAILLLFRQQWRTSINRSAEAMTIFAVMCAGAVPAHPHGPALGRVLGAALFPNQRGPLWVNFRSPLLWDVFAISTYFTVSLVFWYLGHDPRPRHPARPRDRPASRSALYGVLSLGWNGSHRTWSRYETVVPDPRRPGHAAGALGALDREHGLRHLAHPGWHTTIFPPYFVAGAVFSGFGMVLTLLIITRQVDAPRALHHPAPPRRMAKIMLLTGSHRRLRVRHRALHRLVQRQPLRALRLRQPRHRALRLGLLDDGACNVLVPQLFWFGRAHAACPRCS